MTAVDFYHDALLELERKWQTKEIVTFSQWRDMYINAYKQAKEMEKKQIIEAHDAGVNAGYELAKNDDIYIDSGGFKNTCNSQKYYFIKYEKGEQ
jgi:hypothetical protein